MTASPGRWRDEIVDSYPFELDRFQVEAIEAFDEGAHVVRQTRTLFHRIEVPNLNVQRQWTVGFSTRIRPTHGEMHQRGNGDRPGPANADRIACAAAAASAWRRPASLDCRGGSRRRQSRRGGSSSR